MTNRERAIAIWRRQGGLGDAFHPEDWPEEIDPLVADLDAAERRGAIKVLEFANGPADWNDLADLHNWLEDEFDLDDSIRRLTEARRTGRGEFTSPLRARPLQGSGSRTA